MLAIIFAFRLLTSYRPPQLNMPQQSVLPFWALQRAKVLYSLNKTNWIKWQSKYTILERDDINW